MTTQRRADLAKRYVDQINDELGRIAVVVAGSGLQWERGNGSIRRADIDIATLSVNIRAGDYLVGCDGSKRGINDYLSQHHQLARQNSQNVRYQCDDDRLKSVILHYAQVAI